MMQEQFTTREIALAMKELGFDEPCFCYHLWDGTDLMEEFKDKLSNPLFSLKANSELPDKIAAPLWQQAVDWFRKRYKINILITQCIHTGCWIYTLEGIDDGKSYYNLYRSYEVAREKAILKAIELHKTK